LRLGALFDPDLMQATIDELTKPIRSLPVSPAALAGVYIASAKATTKVTVIAVLNTTSLSIVCYACEPIRHTAIATLRPSADYSEES
jgi:hypothetical protein